MQEATSGAATVTAIMLDPGLTRARAVIAGMMSAGYSVIAAVADGGVMEGAEEIELDPGLAAGARREALIWRRAAQALQGGGGAALG